MPNTNIYSEHVSDTTLAQRRAEFREHTVAAPGTGPFTELIRLIEGEAPDPELLLGAAQQIESRVDGADFVLHGVLAILHRFQEPDDRSVDLLGAEVRAALRSAVLGFRYWPDEPGADSMCSWTESHQILFATGAYLAGQLYPDERFSNSRRSGREQMNRFRPRVERWLDLRFRTGFSEWLSHVNYDEDLTPLLNLVEFAYDPKLVRSATMVIDTMLLDLVLNQFRGAFGSTHGRSVGGRKFDAQLEETASFVRMICGTNAYRVGAMGASLMSVSARYEVPGVVMEIAADTDRPELEVRQRMGIRVENAEQWGLGFRSVDDGMVFLSLEAHLHERIAPLTLRMIDRFNWWENDFFAPLRKRRGLIEFARRTGLVRPLMRLFARDVTRSTREEVNTYTYRTPDFMMSCAQDYRAGYGGDQQHVWQATLGPRAVVFTTHPGRGEEATEASTPDYWTGSGTLPRAAQYKNVLICHYRVDTSPGLCLTNREHYTHAWFPRAAFEEVRETDGWIIARRGDGYVGLWSQNPYEWRRAGAGEETPNELVVPGKSNIWICVCGRAVTHGDFDSFCERVSASSIAVTGRGARERVGIDVAPHGKIGFGWTGPLTVGGWEMPITSHRHGSPYPVESGYRRYDTPYVSADFPANIVRVRCNDETLALNWRDQARSASSFL